MQLSAQPRPLEWYEALSQARLAGATCIAHLAEHGDDLTARALHLQPVAAEATPNAPHVVGAPIATALEAAFALCSAEEREQAQRGFRRQIEAHMQQFVKRFFAGEWARAVLDQKLSRPQYVATLQNMHQYVRFTTRLLGQAVSISPTSALRAHFAEHLRGEVNHELIIERDLKHLGENVEHLLSSRYANTATRAFMVAQQSMVAFERDPILFMTCPLAAEGITAHLDKTFLQGLRECVRSYGVKDADKATMFFSSHIVTDGGDDGHWEATMRILEQHLPTENKLGEFLSVLALATEAIERSFNANVTELSLFSR